MRITFLTTAYLLIFCLSWLRWLSRKGVTSFEVFSIFIEEDQIDCFPMVLGFWKKERESFLSDSPAEWVWAWYFHSQKCWSFTSFINIYDKVIIIWRRDISSSFEKVVRLFLLSRLSSKLSSYWFNFWFCSFHLDSSVKLLAFLFIKWISACSWI